MYVKKVYQSITNSTPPLNKRLFRRNSPNSPLNHQEIKIMVDQLSDLQTITSKGDIKKLNHLKHIAERHHEQLKEEDHPTYSKLMALLNKTRTVWTVSMDETLRDGQPLFLWAYNQEQKNIKL